MQSHVVVPPSPTTDPLAAFHLGQLKELAERLNRRYLEEADRDARSASEALRAYAALLEAKAPPEAGDSSDTISMSHVAQSVEQREVLSGTAVRDPTSSEGPRFDSGRATLPIPPVEPPPAEATEPSSIVRAGDAFAATFKREPTSPSDAAWLNGYAAALGAPVEPGAIQQAAKLLQDLRVNSTHPRHLEWRAECDKWLESINAR